MHFDQLSEANPETLAVRCPFCLAEKLEAGALVLAGGEDSRLRSVRLQMYHASGNRTKDRAIETLLEVAEIKYYRVERELDLRPIQRGGDGGMRTHPD